MFDLVRGVVCGLRRPNVGDLDTLVAWMQDDFLNTTVFDGDAFEGGAKKQAKRWIEENARVYGSDSLLALAFSLKSEQPIGMVLFSNIDWKSRTTDVRYLVGEAQYRNSVFGPEIALLSLQVAFHQLNMHKVYGYVLSSNLDSISLATFAGPEELILKHYMHTDKGWEDYHLFSMFSGDFQALLEEQKDGVLRRHFRDGLFQL